MWCGQDAGIVIKVDTDVRREVDGADSELELDDYARMNSKVSLRSRTSFNYPSFDASLSTCIMSDPCSLHRDKMTMCKIGPAEPKIRLCRQVLAYKLYRYVALFDRPSANSQDCSGLYITYMVPSWSLGSLGPSEKQF